MKLLLCSDIHDPASEMPLLREKALGVDLVVCAGDMGLFGRGLVEVLEDFNSWGVPVFVIHGNHEDLRDVSLICDSLKNVMFFHGELVNFQGLTLIGWGGGGFSFRDRGFERFVSSLDLDFSRSILVTHGPAFETCLDEVQRGVHVGNDSFRSFILKKKPLVAVSGHIHETSGLVCDLEGVVLINPGPEGVVIEL